LFGLWFIPFVEESVASWRSRAPMASGIGLEKLTEKFSQRSVGPKMTNVCNADIGRRRWGWEDRCRRQI